jgi:ribosomal protein S18 acetylase RimI-like enzyme
MKREFELRKGMPSDLEAVLRIATSLDSWFNDDGLKYIEQDLEFERLIIAEVDSQPVGFLSFFIYEGVGYLGWIGVLERFHGCGAGEALFLEFEREMKKSGIHTLQVKTLGESVDYPPYERTRSYYRKMGFEKHRTEVADNPECPEELILRKTI